jgi:DNA phosphorothioation-associated putative methyltransferase
MPLFTARRLFVNLAALMVHEFSRPVTALLQDGLLTKDISYLHLHCGRGEDLSGLSVLGYKAAGWDGIFQPETRHAADIVNLGYYLGELSEQANRAEALASAYKLTTKILVVAGVLNEASVSQQMIYFRDPALTEKTHLRYSFEHHELQQ